MEYRITDNKIHLFLQKNAKIVPFLSAKCRYLVAISYIFIISVVGIFIISILCIIHGKITVFPEWSIHKSFSIKKGAFLSLLQKCVWDRLWRANRLVIGWIKNIIFTNILSNHFALWGKIATKGAKVATKTTTTKQVQLKVTLLSSAPGRRALRASPHTDLRLNFCFLRDFYTFWFGGNIKSNSRFLLNWSSPKI